MYSSTMYYSFNNTRLNFLYLFPIIMSHSEKSEYMAPLLKVWLSFYTNMHVYSCCMFAHAYVELSRSLASLRWVSTCADDCETTTSPKLTDRISRSNRYDSASGLHVLCTHFCLRLGISEFTKWQKAALCTQPYWQHFPQCTETQSLNRKSGLKRLLNERCTTAISPNAN